MALEFEIPFNAVLLKMNNCLFYMLSSNIEVGSKKRKVWVRIMVRKEFNLNI